MTLTPTQLKILEAIAAGANSNEIAAARFISIETVKSHVQNLRGRLGAKNRAHAVGLAYEYGILPLDPELSIKIALAAAKRDVIVRLYGQESRQALQAELDYRKIARLP
jgi:DNA-binding CsgD family transcriptional regulator